MTSWLCGDVHYSELQVDGAGRGVRGDGYAAQGSPQRPRQRLQEAPRADPHPVCWSVTSIESSVSDPYSFDPDPAFEAENRFRSRAMMTKNWKKITAKKEKLPILPVRRPPLRMSNKLQRFLNLRCWSMGGET